jgi:hypothetical protein
MQTFQHDPGGKVRIRLDDRTVGSALFSPCGVFRTRLERVFGTPEGRMVLFVGMNPSTADAEVNDSTVNRESGYARRWGFDRLVKVNWASRRATFPKDLLGAGVQISCDQNLRVIAEECRQAELVVLAHGVPHKQLLPVFLEALETVAVATAQHPEKVVALALSAEGFPRHSLYLRRDAEPRPFDLAGFIARLRIARRPKVIA